MAGVRKLRRREGLWLILLVILAVGANADGLLDAIPAESLFCVRINNFDRTLGVLDQFLAGATPMPMGASMMVRMQLAQLLGDPTLQGLDTTGSFAIFGAAKAKDSNSVGPSDIFGAAILPAKDYAQFVSLSANVSEADANGVSAISPGGPGGGGQAIVAKAGQFALLGSKKNYDELLGLAKSISAGKCSSIAKSLEAEQTKQATEAPLWAYGDIQKINKTFGPAITQALEKIQAEAAKEMMMTGQPQPMNPTRMLKVYFDVFKAFLEQGRYASVTLTPEPTVLKLSKTVAAMPGTEMAKMLTADASLPKQNKLLGYLEDGAFGNFAAKIHKGWMEKLADFGISFFKAMPAGSVSEEELAEWTQLSKDSAETMGNLVAISAKPEPGAKPPIAAKYIVEIKDKEKFEQEKTKAMELMKGGAFFKMYEQMGMKCDLKWLKGVGEYKGVLIDSMKFSIKATDANSMQAQMIQQMYGGGFEYRMAYTNGLFLTVFSSDPDAGIRQLIDTVKAGGPKEMSSEIQAATTLLPGAKDADFVGTLNIIRLMQMGMAFAPVPMPISLDAIATKSNVVMAGRAADGKLMVDVALPKEHLTELTTGIQMIQQQQMQMQQQQQMQQQSQPPAQPVE